MVAVPEIPGPVTGIPTVIPVVLATVTTSFPVVVLLMTVPLGARIKVPGPLFTRLLVPVILAFIEVVF
jgi:hypothetical protein